MKFISKKFDVHQARELHSIHALQFGLEGLNKVFIPVLPVLYTLLSDLHTSKMLALNIEISCPGRLKQINRMVFSPIHRC